MSQAIDSRETTAGNIPPPHAEIIVKPSPSVIRAEDDHHQRRLFLGPMPETVALQLTDSSRDGSGHTQGVMMKGLSLFGMRKHTPSQPMHTRRSLSSEDGVSRERAFRFFMSKGGRKEDFDNQERSIRREIAQRLKQSRWLLAEENQKTSTTSPAKKWIGDSFEVGKDVLGLSVMAPQHEEPPILGRTGIADDESPSLASLASPEEGAKAFSEVLRDTTISPRSKAKAAETNIPNLAALTAEPVEQTLSDVAIKSLGTPASQTPSLTPKSHGEPSTSRTALLAPPRTATPEPISGGSTISLPSKLPDIKRSGSVSSLKEAAGALRSALRVPTRSDSPSGKKGKGKVTFPVDSARPTPRSQRGEETAAHPLEVLTREPSPKTSAGAAARINEELEPLDDAEDVVLRDRMLIRVLSTAGSISKYLDEQQLLEMPEVRRERATMWREYLVVWRKSSIELYEQYTITAKEWFTKHKHLAYKIPLIPIKTTISIFSRVDMSFCITCPKFTAHSHLPVHHEDKQTTLIFLCKTKSRSRSVDWVWRLWRRLGGEIPDSVEIRCPAIDARVSFPIPVIDLVTEREGYRSFTREKVIQSCREQMSGIPEWDLLIESALKPGEGREAGQLELCWRTESNLDWAWLQEDINGLNRPWSVLFGVALMNPRFPSELELRVAEHFPTKLALDDGAILREPPALEGYLYRYKSETHLRESVYLATHNGNIFFIPQHYAHPPQPPTAAMQEDSIEPDQLSADPATDPANKTGSAPVTRASEVRRGAAQILNAKSFLDIRNIETVKRAEEVWSTVAPRRSTSKRAKPRESTSVRARTTSSTTNATTTESHPHEGRSSDEGLEVNHDLPPVDFNPQQGTGEVNPIDLTPEDEDDPGGDEALDALTGDAKQELKKRRSFEVILRNSEVMRFEAYSCKIAVEWVNGLMAMVLYWTRRQRVDARLEMDIVHAMSGRTRFLVPRVGENVYPAPPPDPREASPLLGRWWHWCVLEGCRSIVRAGRLFMKTGTKGQMRHYYFVLVAGHLIRFRLTSSHVHSPRALHSHAKTINLLDAFVTSGHFAALELDEGNSAFEPVPRRFQDGLETDDRDMDTLIIIRYRSLSTDRHLERLPQPVHPDVSGKAASHAGITMTTTTTTHTKWMGADVDSVPPLNSYHKLLVLRARSKLERDAWCWALNAEIERLVRVNASREQAVRDDGGIQT
ncbi:hypothetical protein FRC17_006633 [Serendipita sp. 399]|nr:hypothetical protein FRC17_006633 [Serendipita sp. 399]